MKRRHFLAVLGGALAVWPLAARAQPSEQMRRIGVLMNRAADNAPGQARLSDFRQALQQFGWDDGRNIRIETRWSGSDIDVVRRDAAELIALAPDVILAVGTVRVAALQSVSPAVPIVFVSVTDPVGAGVVDTLARPGGNTTGFMLLEYSASGKWLELLKQIAPLVTRVAVLRDPANPAGVAQFGAIQAASQVLGVEIIPLTVRSTAGELERAVAAFARPANGGLIVTGSAAGSAHHDLIITLAAQHKLPAVYSSRDMAARGGLISYGADLSDEFRRAASYVDRILKGERPADLPVQAPTKYELVINLKTAKTLGLTVPPGLLATANEVIE
jgi:putative tryptophan/tyrosine transport system substrate-binding protein